MQWKSSKFSGCEKWLFTPNKHCQTIRSGMNESHVHRTSRELILGLLSAIGDPIGFKVSSADPRGPSIDMEGSPNCLWESPQQGWETIFWLEGLWSFGPKGSSVSLRWSLFGLQGFWLFGSTSFWPSTIPYRLESVICWPHSICIKWCTDSLWRPSTSLRDPLSARDVLVFWPEMVLCLS